VKSRWFVGRIFTPALRLVVRLFAPRWAVGGLALLRDTEGRVCLLRHRLRPHPWGLPGGYAAWPEDPREATARECAEELALHVDPANLVLEAHLTGDLFALLEVVFSCTRTITEAEKAAFRLQTREVLEARWFTHAEVEALEGILARHRAIITAFLRARATVR